MYENFFLVKIDFDSAHPPVQTAPPAKYYFSKKREKCQWTLIANIFCSSNICIAKYYFNKKRGKEEKWVSLELFLFNYFDFLIYFMLNILIGKYHCCSKIGIGSMEFGRKLFFVFLKLGRKPTVCVLGIRKKIYLLCFWNLEENILLVFLKLGIWKKTYLLCRLRKCGNSQGFPRLTEDPQVTIKVFKTKVDSGPV